MPRQRKTCPRCRGPIAPEMAWCARCLCPTPWASALSARNKTQASDWPDIWTARRHQIG